VHQSLHRFNASMPSALIIGLGKSGVAAARLLQTQDWQAIICDRQQSESLLAQQAMLSEEGIQVWLNYKFNPVVPKLPGDLKRVVVSPGVPWDLPALVAGREAGLEIIGEMELAWRHLQTPAWVGITGTNGKTTTTALTAAIFQQAGFDAPACGNIGIAGCEMALEANKIGKAPDWVIAELSSYQIESSPTISPQIGIFTTLTPDHLNRHYTIENYFNIKARLLDQSQHRILNGDDPYLRKHGPDRWPNAYWTSTQGLSSLPANPELGTVLDAGWVVAQGQRIVHIADLKMPGSHNQQNLLMAVAAAQLAGITPEAIATAVKRFSGVPHRLESICTWEGITFINDSKATNYDAAQVGLASVKAPVILIAGGQAKEGDDQRWIQTIRAKAATVVLIGEAAPVFAQRFKEMGYTSYETVSTLEQAVPRAAALAQQQAATIVLFSPACASFDQYPNFEQRGDHFRQLCQNLQG
jgi:UDP-N-acetylmuramoylalanine--D-glutamate ligase